MKSGSQIDGQMSSQSPVIWWYRDVNCEVVGCRDVCRGGLDLPFKILTHPLFIIIYYLQSVLHNFSSWWESVKSVRVIWNGDIFSRQPVRILCHVAWPPAALHTPLSQRELEHCESGNAASRYSTTQITWCEARRLIGVFSQLRSKRSHASVPSSRM
jgi:hypothetical protein